MNDRRLESPYVVGGAPEQKLSGVEEVRVEMRRAFGIPDAQTAGTAGTSIRQTPSIEAVIALNTILQNTDRGPHTGYTSDSAVMERMEPPLQAIPWLS